MDNDNVVILTGITGQDSSIMADLLLEKGYMVVGMNRRKSGGGDWRIRHLHNHKNFCLEYGDLTDSGSLRRLVRKYKPGMFFNLGAQSQVHVSWKEPVHTLSVNIIGTLNCLEAIRDINPKTKFYQASSSEIFGKVTEVPQRESTFPYPRSPYGISKLAAYWLTRNYRESFNLFACNGILFNHTGIRRGIEFVERKITNGVAKIYLGIDNRLELGNIDSKRDFGSAQDYMEAAYLMLQKKEPDDYVIATGETHSIRELLEIAFGHLNMNYKDYVVQNPKFMRPAEVDLLLGDASKARRELGWKPKHSFKDMICEMVDKDIERIRNGVQV